MNANDRIQWFHKMVSDGCYPNSRDISQKFDISPRQAQRDLVHLKNVLGAPLEYDSAHKGYRYTSEFFLPSMVRTENESDYSAVLAGLHDFHNTSAEVSVIQMQLPYTATLEIEDKITVMNLRQFIVKDLCHHQYVCEFPSIELFFGVIFSSGAQIRIITPEWMRERLVEFAKRILETNS